MRGFFSLLILSSLLAASVASALPAPSIVFIDKWGSRGHDNGEFYEPFDIGVDMDGDLYVSDTVNHRIQKFDPLGNFILKWGSKGTGNGEFKDPVGLTVDAAQKVYVSEFSGDRVQKFNDTGGYILQWGSKGSGDGEFRTADDSAVDPHGQIWVIDKRNHRVQKFSPTGVFIAAYGDSGVGNGQFTFPVGIAIDSLGNVFIAEQGDPEGDPLLGGHRIQKFDSTFSFITKWGANGGDGTPGSANGEFNQPIHLSADRQGNIYVPDSKNHRIQVFDNDGNFIVAWGDSGTGDYQFNEPEGVVVSLDNYIYVADTHNDRIMKFKFGTSPSSCPECLVPPPSGTANFIAGEPFTVAGDTIAVPLLVNTADNVLSSNFTVEYDSLCLEFAGAMLGDDTSAPGMDVTSDAFDLPDATTPGLNKHVTITVTENFGNDCEIEVLVLKFVSLVGPSPNCKIVWDRSTPPGNPPNHLNTDTPEQVTFPNITFCDLDSFDLTAATFEIGPSSIVSGCVEVPLLVTTDEDVFFTNMTVDYHSDCLTFKQALLGADTSDPGKDVTGNSFDLPGAWNASMNRHVTIGVTESFGPGVVKHELLRLRFEFEGTQAPPCSLLWDRASPPGNPPNHMLTNDPSTIRPEQISFLDGLLENNCTDVTVSGDITYAGNGASILPDIPDVGTTAVRVFDYTDTNNDSLAVSGSYSLDFGAGPIDTLMICAERDKADCDLLEGGVLSGQDLLLIQDWAITPPAMMTREFVAGDITKDGMIMGNDVMALRQWIAKAAVCGAPGCSGANCAGTWRFIFPTGVGPGDFEIDKRTINGACGSQLVPIEGILLGDADQSWPQIFPKGSLKPSAVPATFEILERTGEEVVVGLRSEQSNGASVHHLIYSLNYDATALEYLGQGFGTLTREWDGLDNPATAGVTHGVIHRRSGQDGVEGAGTWITFRFRVLDQENPGSLQFSRLKVNDAEVSVAALHLGDESSIERLPQRHSLSSYPNPFNPMTTVSYTIPPTAGTVRVVLQVYDISGRLVRTLLDQSREPGHHSVTWNGIGNNNHEVGAGIYFLRIRAGEWTQVQKITLVK